MAQLPEHFHPSSTDSAGQPWAGRTFEANPFGNDDGTTPATVAAAMTSFREGSGDEQAVVDALRPTRVLIPLVAELGEAGENDAGVTVDKSADLSIVTVAGPDGRTVLPVFTSTDAMRSWNAAARPVPVELRTAALAAADEQTELIIVDPGSDGEFGLRRPAVWAVAQASEWVPSHRNPNVAAALAEGIVAEDVVRRVEIAPSAEPGSLIGPELEVTLVVDPAADRDELRSAVQRVNQRWATSPGVVTAVDSMAVCIAAREAGDSGPVPTVAEVSATASGGATASETDASGPPSHPRGIRKWFGRRGRSSP